MPETQHDEHLDEYDLEISDLPGGYKRLRGNVLPPVLRWISLVPLLSRGHRRLSIFITSSLVIAALLVLLARIVPVRSLFIPAPFETSSASPTRMLSGENLFYFQALPSWGTLTIDERPLPSVPMLSTDRPVRIANGTHQLQWQAHPFEPLRCTLVVPPDPARQTCLTAPFGGSQYARTARLISFPGALSLAFLPNAPRRALIQGTQQFLDTLQSSVLVHPGERYAYNRQTDSPLTSSVPLRATQRFVLETDPHIPATCVTPRLGPACSVAGQDCRLFCTLPWPSHEGWNVAAVVRPTWSYIPLEKPDTAPTQALNAKEQGEQQFTTFEVQWRQGRWHVSFHPQGISQFDDPNCIGTVGLIAPTPTSSLPPPAERLTWAFVSGTPRAAGCVAAATLQHGASLVETSPRAADAYLLERFGVLLAANDLAHQLWPTLPTASAEERALAQRITQQATFVS